MIDTPNKEQRTRLFQGILQDAKRNYYHYDSSEIDELERWINGAPAMLPFEDICGEIQENPRIVKEQLQKRIDAYRKVKG